MKQILSFILFLFCLNSYSAPSNPSTIHTGKIRQTAYVFEDITPDTFLNVAKQIVISSGLRLSSSILFTASQLYRSRNAPLKAEATKYAGYSLSLLWHIVVFYGQAQDIYPRLHNQLGALFCGKRRRSVPFFIKNQWLADRIHFIFKTSPENLPILWMTPIDHPKATEGQNEIPGWQHLLDALKRQDIQHLGVSIASAPKKSPDGRLPMKLQVRTHYHSGRQTLQDYPIDDPNEAGIWDLQLMSWLCLPHTIEKIYSLFDSRTIQQLAGLLSPDTPGTLKPEEIEVTASGRGYLLAQVKTGQQEHFKLGYSAYGHYVILESSGRSVSELERLLSSPQSRSLMAHDSKQQVVEWTRPLAMSLQAVANYGTEKAGRLLVRQGENFLFQVKEKVISKQAKALKKAKPIYLNRQLLMILSSLMVSPTTVVPEANAPEADNIVTTLTEDKKGDFENGRKQSSPNQQTGSEIDIVEPDRYQTSQINSALSPPASVDNVDAQPERLVIESEDSWAQSVFFAISSLGGEPGGSVPQLSVLYGSRGFVVGMQMMYGRTSASIIPDDWDFMVEKNSLGPLLEELGVPEEIQYDLLTHQNKKKDLFEYTKEFGDGRKLSIEVLAYNIHVRDPKGVRITLHQPEEGEQAPKMYQFDLLLVEGLPLYDSVFVPSLPNFSWFYCNIVKPTYYLENWEDMWSRLDKKALKKALPRIKYWLQEERLKQAFPGTGVLQRLTTLANNVGAFLSSSNEDTTVSSGASPPLKQQLIVNLPSFAVTQNSEESWVLKFPQPDKSPESNEDFDNASGVLEHYERANYQNKKLNEYEHLFYSHIEKMERKGDSRCNDLTIRFNLSKLDKMLQNGEQNGIIDEPEFLFLIEYLQSTNHLKIEIESISERFRKIQFPTLSETTKRKVDFSKGRNSDTTFANVEPDDDLMNIASKVANKAASINLNKDDKKSKMINKVGASRTIQKKTVKTGELYSTSAKQDSPNKPPAPKVQTNKKAQRKEGLDLQKNAVGTVVVAMPQSLVTKKTNKVSRASMPEVRGAAEQNIPSFPRRRESTTTVDPRLRGDDDGINLSATSLKLNAVSDKNDGLHSAPATEASSTGLPEHELKTNPASDKNDELNSESGTEEQSTRTTTVKVEQHKNKLRKNGSQR